MVVGDIKSSVRSVVLGALCEKPPAALRTGMLLACLLLDSAAVHAQQAAPSFRPIFIDAQGVMRWRDNRQEVSLYGANYIVTSASDYRAAGYLGQDRKKLIDQDMAHFARMGWTGLRISLWGDWENSDRAGNLLANDHLDLMDYLIARARERGIYMLFSPIQTYSSNWPDALQDTTLPGFSRHFSREQLGKHPEAIAAQVNYLKQILAHVNPYTGLAIKDDPSIPFVELVNEPWHHSADVEGSVRYINALTDAVRSTGSKQIIFYNVSQDFRIGEAIRKSKVQGISFGWYPTGLNSGHELRGNYLRSVDVYPDLLRPELHTLPRISYEFDSADLVTGYMYPAMARTFRSVGAQFAAMFAYDMLGTASRNLGWQTHYLNLVYTPRKAMSAVIAAEVMRRLPRLASYGSYPDNTRFGDFRVSYEDNASELVAADAFLYAGSTRAAPPQRDRLQRIAGYGSSPVVRYDGQGVYFLDRIRNGVWRLEVYPDAVPVRDPFEMQSPDKVVTRAIYRAWPMSIDLPDLGPSFTIQSITDNKSPQPAANTRFSVTPGVYILSAAGPVDRQTLPQRIGYLRLDEFHAPQPDRLPLQVVVDPPGEHVAGRPLEIQAQVVDSLPPDRVSLSMRTAGAGGFRSFPMQPAGGYTYSATVPADALRDGPYEWAITATRRNAVTTFPEGVNQSPQDWNFHGRSFWKTLVVRPETPLRLFKPEEDVPALAFTRIGDAIRRGIYRVVPSDETGAPVFHLELPVNVGGFSPEDYTASLVVQERIAARQETVSRAKHLQIRLRGLGPHQRLHLTLVEHDGTSWSAPVVVDRSWSEQTIELADFRPTRAAMLPAGFPGNWNYWMGAARGRAGPGDQVRVANLERLQFSLRREDDVNAAPGTYGVEIEWVSLRFTL